VFLCTDFYFFTNYKMRILDFIKNTDGWKPEKHKPKSTLEEKTDKLIEETRKQILEAKRKEEIKKAELIHKKKHPQEEEWEVDFIKDRFRSEVILKNIWKPNDKFNPDSPFPAYKGK